MNTTTEQTVVERMLDDLKADVAKHLCHYSEPSAIVPRLLAYRDAVAPNFVPWMTHVWVRCQSDVARRACQDNLSCEVAEDHPAMLFRYVAQVGDQAERYQDAAASVLQRLAPTLHVIAALTQRSALDGLLIMAALENTSLVFIPEMKRWGEVLNFTDFEYVDKHGIADIEHADEFRKAVEAEVAVIDQGSHRFREFLFLHQFLTIMRDQPHRPPQYSTLHYVSDLLHGIFA